MSQSFHQNDVFLICNESGTVLEIYDKESIGKTPFKLGHNLTESISEDSLEHFFDFLRQLHSNGFSNDHTITFTLNKEPMFYVMSAIERKDRIFILATPIDDLKFQLDEELMRINNEQTNHFRMTLKESMVKHREYERLENERLDEISKLNNELVNSRRELSKKNQQLNALNEKLERQAIQDPMTGLLNRRQLVDLFNDSKERAKRMNTKLIIASIDINHFKQVNDQLGHAEGDRLLIYFADLAQQMTRQGFDYIFRVGGDEFLFILLDCSLEDANAIYDRINASFILKSSIASLAFGAIEVDPTGLCTLDECLRIADERMYAHKKKFR
jgi:diguanylate cyclase (GGDEF)-like protein